MSCNLSDHYFLAVADIDATRQGEEVTGIAIHITMDMRLFLMNMHKMADVFHQKAVIYEA